MARLIVSEPIILTAHQLNFAIIFNLTPFFIHTYFQSVLSVETNTKNVTAAISVLNSRLGLLEPSHLEHVEGRLAALLQKLNSISEKKAALEDSEKNNKVRAHHMFSRILNFLFVIVFSRKSCLFDKTQGGNH